MTKNYIYIISNPSFPDFLKIGKTIDIRRRLASYNTCDPLRRYKCEFLIQVGDPSLYERVFTEHGNSEWTQIGLSDCIKVITELKAYERTKSFEDDGIISINKHQWRCVPRSKEAPTPVGYRADLVKTFICARNNCGCIMVTTKTFQSKPRRRTFSTIYNLYGILHKEEPFCLLTIK